MDSLNMQEKQVGILRYLSDTEGIKGSIKQTPDDFIVCEITPEGTVLKPGKNETFEDKGGDYTHFTLEKRDWNTMRAVSEISKRVGVSRKRFKFAGTKDRKALTVQRVSAWKVSKENLEKVRLKDIELRDFSKSDEPVNLGCLQGNYFMINIDGVEEGLKRTKSIVKELDGKVPNFFGLQRFGNRLNNHIVGRKLLKGSLEEAAMEFLCGGRENEENENAREAREAFEKSRDVKGALNDFPNYLGYEKSVLNHLAVVPTDYAGALRRLPKKLRWMFVHAYQAYIFNHALSRHIKEGNAPEELPLVGSESAVDDTTAQILLDEDIKKEEFEIKPMPELSSKGEFRRSFITFKEFKAEDLNPATQKIRVSFKLGKGSYATSVLREFMKN